MGLGFKRKMKQWHKWVGLIFMFFLLMSATSGIFLNHRRAISSIDIPRAILPSEYQYENWNNGAVKGSLKLSSDSILLYGGSGIWLTNAAHNSFTAYTEGIKEGADNRMVNHVLATPDHRVFAVTTFGFYELHRNTNEWKSLSCLIDSRERFTDIALDGDGTLVLMTRSYIYTANKPYTHFNAKELPAPDDYKREVSLFKTMWTLHSGEMFGMTGKIIVDLLGVVAILLCITGLILTFCPQRIKRKKRRGTDTKRDVSLFKSSLKWHNKLGAVTVILLLIVCISGMFLRPPLLISIIRGKTKPLPGSTLDSKNPWFDKLRCLRYDIYGNEWMLYSSDGFYALETLASVPQKIQKAPVTSVMGITVLQQQDSVNWVVGSFSGIYLWNKESGESLNYYTGKPVAPRRAGPPTITDAVSGFSSDFTGKNIVFEYRLGAQIPEEGEQFAEMPASMKAGRMSLWHLCLEIHVGRIYAPILGVVTDLFVFLSGVLLLIILLTGYIVYRRRRRKRR